MKIKTDRFVETAQRELKNERSRSFLRFLPRAFLGMREAGMATFPDPQTAQAYAAAIRAEAIARLPDLLEEFERNATARGARVLWAKDAREACDLVIELARERGISYTAKGKSMVTEEMGLNEALKDAGIEAFETDLGEFIAQQLDRPPSIYVTIDNGPKKRDEIDGPEELIVIIVDNGRSDFYGDLKFREALRCIRCGACLNTCPVYTKIGGYPYGFAYSGPIGQVLNPLLLGFDRTRDLYHACTLCGACKAICPGGVDHPGLFLHYRSLETAGFPGVADWGAAGGRKRLFDLWTFGVMKQSRWEFALKKLRPWINRRAKKGVLTNFKGALSGWFHCRDLPAIAEKTFHERWDELSRKD